MSQATTSEAQYLSTLPQIINIDHYGGDTLTLHHKVAPEVIDGREFFAQIRSKASSSRVDATFSVVLTVEGADLILSSADSRALCSRGLYEGAWDVQLAATGGADPVTTLAYGEFRVHPDVTRPS